MLYKSLQETENKLTELAYKPVLGRIAEALLSFKNYQSEEDKELVPVFEINRKDLASMTGTVKETVIRSIKSLKREGVLATNGSKIIILNEDKLAEISKLYD
jgi:CRP/FNR family transcriptional regulator, polysaccharide utilization system transcription regulator